MLLLAAILLLVALLLELNRWLPGVWPGGGGPHGSRPTAGGVTTDPSRLTAGTTPPTPPPAMRTVPVVVISPGPEAGSADPAAEASVAVRWGERVGVPATGRPGTLLLPLGLPPVGAPAGDRPTDAPPATVPPDLFEVRRDDLVVWHGAPMGPVGTGADGTADRTWDVVLPRGPVPPRPAPGTGRDVVVVDDRGPVSNAIVEWVGRGAREGTARSDTEGRVRIPRDAGPLVRVHASSEAHGEAFVYAHLDAPGPLRVVLLRNVPVATTFVDEAGATLRPGTIRTRVPGAAPRTIDRDEGFAGLQHALPSDVVADGYVEVEIPGRPPAAFPLATLAATTQVPLGRTATVTVRSERGGPVVGATVVARWPLTSLEPGDGQHLTSTARSGTDGSATLIVPRDRDVTLLVTANDLAPTSLPLGRDDAPTAVTLAAAGKARVRVVGADGKPAAFARVVVLLRIEAASDRRNVVADADGMAVVPDLPAGFHEVLAHAPGHAWGSTTFTLTPGVETAATVALARGFRLHLVVEDPDGVPVPGVTVRSVERVERGGPTPDDPDRAPWTTDAHGALVVDDLPPHPLDLYLHAAGHRDEHVLGVTPGPRIVFVTLVPRR